MNHKVLITGAQGFIGRHVCALFDADKNWDVDTLGLNPANKFRTDLASTVPELHDSNYDLVVHLAGTCSDADADRVNRQGTANLLSALSGSVPRRIIYMSSCAVYGRESGHLIDESEQCRPATPYGKSKLDAENLLGEWCLEHGTSLTILRPATVMGTGMHGRIMQLAKGIQSGCYMHIPGCDGSRSFIHVEDIARICHDSLQAEGVYNLTDGVPHSLQTLAEALSARLHRKRVLRLAPGLTKPFNLAVRLLPFLKRRIDKLSADLTFSADRLQKALPSDFVLTDVVNRLYQLASETD